jgi:REP element-mobilizing transposase RayT
MNSQKRDYKHFAAGECYHIFNRGNGKMDIFLSDDDYSFFLFRLKEYLFPGRRRCPSAETAIGAEERYTREAFPEDSFSLIAYCLMPNHFHLQIRQNMDVSISALMLRLGGSYAKCFNKKYDRVGSLFQDQFKAVSITSDNQMAALSAYIHQNPKVAGLVRSPEDWAYSSYPEYLGLRKGTLVDTGIVLEGFGGIRDYQSFVEQQYEGIIERKEIENLLVD